MEKHPATITALAFYEDRVLISGSVDGRVNLCDLDSEDNKKWSKSGGKLPRVESVIYESTCNG